MLYQQSAMTMDTLVEHGLGLMDNVFVYCIYLCLTGLCVSLLYFILCLQLLCVILHTTNFNCLHHVQLIIIRIDAIIMHSHNFLTRLSQNMYNYVLYITYTYYILVFCVYWAKNVYTLYMYTIFYDIYHFPN